MSDACLIIPVQKLSEIVAGYQLTLYSLTTIVAWVKYCSDFLDVDLEIVRKVLVPELPPQPEHKYFKFRDIWP